MPDLVTLHQAKHQLNLPLTPSEQDHDYELLLAVATELVLDYVRQRVNDADAWSATVNAWDSTTAPRAVIAAILRMFTHLWRWRGDDLNAPPQDEGQALPRDVRGLLTRLRDPAVS